MIRALFLFDLLCCFNEIYIYIDFELNKDHKMIFKIILFKNVEIAG